MRIIAGEYRGMRLAAPAGHNTRPTADRVKEALFSILASRIDFDGLRVLDICAGTGSLGIEALSRGAAHAVFVERDRRVVAVLEGNLARLPGEGRSELLRLDALQALRLLADRGGVFDLVLFDPPYSSDLYRKVPDELVRGGLLAEDGLLVVERATKAALPEPPDGLAHLDTRTYGDTTLDLFRMEAA